MLIVLLARNCSWRTPNPGVTLTREFSNLYYSYHHSLFAVSGCTKYIQNHSSMAIKLFFENELKLMEKQTAHLDPENAE